MNHLLIEYECPAVASGVAPRDSGFGIRDSSEYRRNSVFDKINQPQSSKKTMSRSDTTPNPEPRTPNPDFPLSSTTHSPINELQREYEQ